MIRYGYIVRNITRGEQFYATQGDTPDPNASVWLVDPAVVTTGFDRSAFPGPQIPPTAQFSLFVKAGTDVPAWRAGDIVRVRIVMPEGIANWWTQPSYDVPTWQDRTVILQAPATARTHPDGLYIDFTGVDPLTPLFNQPVTLTRGVESASARWDAIKAAALPMTLNGYPVVDGDSIIAPPQFQSATSDMGPVTFEAAPFGEVVGTLLAGAPVDYASAEPMLGHLTLQPYYGVDGGNTLVEFRVYIARTLRTSNLSWDTPYRLAVVSGEAEQVSRDPLPPGWYIPACAVECPSITWALDQGANLIRLATITDAGAAATQVAQHADLVARDGARPRDVGTQARHNQAHTVVKSLYTAERIDADGIWAAPGFTVDTELLPDDRVLNFETREDIPPRPVAVVDLDDRWALGGAGGGDVVGTVIGCQYVISGGKLQLIVAVYPEIPRLTDSANTGGDDQALTFQQLLDDPTLATVQFQQIDPSITFHDARLIGA